MLSLRVNEIRGLTSGQPVTFTKGFVVPANKPVSFDNISCSGVITATSFSGNGSELTGIPGLTVSEIYSFMTII